MRSLDGSFPGTSPGSHFARLSVPLVSLGTLAAGAGYLAALLPGDAPAWAAYSLAVGIGLLLVGLLLLGARRGGSVSPGIGWVFVATGVWVAGGLILLLTLPGTDGADAPLVLGLPRRAAFLLLGVGLGPGLIAPLAYALVFDRQTLTEEDLELLRETARRVREANETPEGGG